MLVGRAPRGDLNDILSLPTYLLPGATLCVAAWHRTDGRVRVGLAILGMAWLAPGASYALWAVIPLRTLAAVEASSWLLYYAYYPLALLALAFLCELAAPRYGRLRLAIDSLLVVVAAATLQWFFIVRHTPPGARALDTLVDLGLLFPGELAIVFGAAILVYRPTRPGESEWPGWLGVGMFLATVSDFVYEYRKLTPAPWSGPIGDLVFAVAGACVATGAARALPVASPLATRVRPPWNSGLTLLPYLSITSVALLLAVESWRQGLPAPVAGLVLGGGGLMALVIARLHLAQRDLAREASARAAQDARFRALVQGAADAFLVVDAQGTISFASPAFGRMTGQEPFPLGANLSSVVRGEGVAPLLPAPVDGVRRWQVGPTEDPREVEALVADARHEPSVGAMVVTLRDVTERVRLEGRLQEAQKLEVVGRVASSVAHDFNNLLTVVLGNAALALASAADRTRPQWEAVRGAAERGATLARQLLSLGRPAPTPTRVLDLSQQLLKQETMLRTVLPADLGIEVVVPSTPVLVRLDGVRIEQVILNLALNARDATNGAGHLELLLDQVPPPGAVATPGAWARVRVRDDGSGMAEETRARAFDPFFTTKPSHQGTGLGLSTVHRVVTEAGGRVEIDSAPGRGTTITVYLPCVEGDVTSSAAEPDRGVPPQPQGAGRVLVVDDERAVRDVVGRYLSACGFRVLEAQDGVHALEVLDAHAWEVDAVLTDLVMPRMPGEELTRRLRDRAPHLPILCMSGNGLAATDHETVTRLSAPLIQKPLQLDVVARRLTEVIAGVAA